MIHTSHLNALLNPNKPEANTGRNSSSSGSSTPIGGSLEEGTKVKSEAPKELDVKDNKKASASDSARPVSRDQEESFKRSLRTAVSDKKGPTKAVGAPNKAAQAEVQDVQGQAANTVSVLPNPQTVPLKGPAADVDEEILSSPGELHAVLKFMKAMEEEFGVSPQQLVAALSQGQLLQPTPNQMGQDMNLPIKEDFLKGLGLEGSQLRRAEFLYQNMLKEMAQDSMSSYLKQSQKEADIRVVDPSLLRKQERNQGLERMSQSFFRNQPNQPVEGGELTSDGKGAVPPELAVPGQAANKASLRSQNAQNMNSSAAAGAMAIPAGFQAPSAQDTSFQAAAESLPQELTSFKPPTKEAKVSNSESGQSSSSGGGATGLGASLTALAVAAANSGGSSSSFQSGTDGKGENGEQTETSVSAKDSAEGGKSTIDASQFSVGNLKGDSRLAAVASTLATDPRNLERPEDAMNVRNLIQGAQVLLRRGGGEMKVQMHPEGLGQVDLRVSVNEGKVDIQILAETADTKRLLEKGIHELKASLVSQKLDVNEVKVDVSKNMERDLNQQDFNRDQARQFLGQYRDEREAMRQGFFDSAIPRPYKQAAPKTIEPTEKSSEPAKKNSSRLNVVV